MISNPLTNDQTAWIVLFVLAINLIIIGFQGNLGTAFGIIFSPKYVQIDTEF